MEGCFGCWQEAQRADKVAGFLLALRTALKPEYYENISAVLKEVESASRLLRDMYDLFPIYRTRVPVVLYYLNIILPTFQKTMRDMLIYIDNGEIPARTQWTLMSQRLSDQGGMTLAQRFVMYCEALVQTVRLLSRCGIAFPSLQPFGIDDWLEILLTIVSTRSPLYDPTSLELLRVRKREEEKINMDSALIPFVMTDPRVPIVPHQAPPQPSQAELERRHWAEKIFDDQPHSITRLKHRRWSKCFGPPMVDSMLELPHGSTVLFKLHQETNQHPISSVKKPFTSKSALSTLCCPNPTTNHSYRPFDKNKLSVTLYLHADGADLTRLLCRWVDPYFNPLYSCYGVHELCVRRKGSSLQFQRWNHYISRSKIWMALFFKSWERMVLFHAAFVALKARCPLTININPEDYSLAGENILFRAQIIDDGFEHSLAVIQDEKCGGLRLHAAVWNGELRKCPVWTAFITQSSASPKWLNRRSGHRIWLKEICPYVFCANYKKKRQMRPHGNFEIYFVDRAGTCPFPTPPYKPPFACLYLVTRQNSKERVIAADAFEDVFREESDTDSLVMDVPAMSGGNGQ
ncbi:hypothetical protein LAWI1_G000531 [Lachnellula willkommii]|uniref:Uncharacterized protein n=1 Tax=Lachnellula willkommii TaxID=215461 RepID=A0A559MLQ4_9HELO|nr:hypothetical protein LAWI1_G000531 [Lachnellula willkommii]